MLKIFRDDLAIETSEIAALSVNEGREDGETFYCVEAYLKNGGEFELEYFETQIDAEKYLEELVTKIDG